MSIMAKYARIFWPDPKDEDVRARNESVELLRKQFAKLNDLPADAGRIMRRG